MKSVAQLLKQKKGTIFSIAPDASVYECVEMLANKGIGALLVMDGQVLRGIVSERDYARKVILMGKSSKTTKVSEIMTEDVLCVNPGMTNEECMALMTDKRVRHLPVLDAERVVGIVSIGDLVRDLIAEQEFAIKELERYIHG
jgi:CBS domain-containing protein